LQISLNLIWEWKMILDPVYIQEELIARLQISLSVDSSMDANGEFIDCRPSDLQFGQGFIVRIRLGWRSVEAEFITDSFATSLVKTMGNSVISQREVFCDLASHYIEVGGEISLKVNEQDTSLEDIPGLNNEWNSLYISLRKFPVIISNSHTNEVNEIAVSIGIRLFTLLFILIPLEEQYTIKNIEGLPEGAQVRIEVNRYERSSLNRAACIECMGTVCKVCGFDFGKYYGAIGQDFIEVHHLIPVSKLGKDYIINPRTDMIPVCSNCHSMLHRANPPYPPDELSNFLDNRDR